MSLEDKLYDRLSPKGLAEQQDFQMFLLYVRGLCIRYFFSEVETEKTLKSKMVD